jgi:hypothetical protein
MIMSAAINDSAPVSADDTAESELAPTQPSSKPFAYRLALERLVERQPLNLSVGGNHNQVHFAINVALLPQAEDLRHYETAFPGSANYILKAAEEERAHRHRIELQLVAGSERRNDRSQLISGALYFAGAAAATLLGMSGNYWIAGLMLVVTMGGPMAA